MANDTFIKGATAKEIGQYGNINISFNIEKLAEYTNEKGYVNMTIKKRKEVGQYGETHSIILNTWKPGEKTKENNEDLSNLDF